MVYTATTMMKSTMTLSAGSRWKKETNRRFLVNTICNYKNEALHLQGFCFMRIKMKFNYYSSCRLYKGRMRVMCSTNSVSMFAIDTEVLPMICHSWLFMSTNV